MPPTPTILSIQSWVATGHVGNAAAAFPLQRLGAEVWAINTVQFSNHPGHGAFTGQVFSGADVDALVQGIQARHLLPRASAVLSGYMGDPGIGHAILRAVAATRAANPAALYCCDPVIGDAPPGQPGRVFVRPGIPELIAQACVPQADILTPNRFELATLTGRPTATTADALAAIASLQSRMAPTGPAIVLLTSLDAAETPPGSVDLLAAGRTSAHRLRVPRLPISPNGAGDAIAALFLLHILRTHSPRQALEAAGSAIAGLLRLTHERGADELLIVEAQDEFVTPSTPYTAEDLAFP